MLALMARKETSLVDTVPCSLRALLTGVAAEAQSRKPGLYEIIVGVT